MNKCAPALFVFLWAQNTGPVNIQRYTVAVCGAYVMSVQHAWKCCCDFADGLVNVTDEALSGRPATAKTFVSDIDEMLLVHSRVSPKQLLLTCVAPHGIFLDTVRGPLGQGSANCDPRAATAPRLHFLRRANHVSIFSTENTYLITS